MLTVYRCIGEQQLTATAEQFQTLEELKNVPSEATFKGITDQSLLIYYPASNYI